MPRRGRNAPRVQNQGALDEEVAAQEQKGSILKPEMKKKEESILEYLDYFKRVMTANSWDDQRGGTILPAMIPTGDHCLSVVKRLGPVSFSVIENELNTCQEPFREANLTKLMNSKKVENESVLEYKEKVAELVKAVYPTFKLEQQNQLCRDFLLHGLPSSLREKAMVVKPNTTEEVVNATLMAESIADAKQAVFELTNETVPNEVDEIVKPSAKTSRSTDGFQSQRNSSSYRRYATARQNFRTSMGIARKNRTSNSYSHLPVEDRFNWNTAPLICFNCGGEGHVARLCPSPPKPWPTDLKQEN